MFYFEYLNLPDKRIGDFFAKTMGLAQGQTQLIRNQSDGQKVDISLDDAQRKTCMETLQSHITKVYACFELTQDGVPKIYHKGETSYLVIQNKEKLIELNRLLKELENLPKEIAQTLGLSLLEDEQISLKLDGENDFLKLLEDFQAAYIRSTSIAARESDGKLVFYSPPPPPYISPIKGKRLHARVTFQQKSDQTLFGPFFNKPSPQLLPDLRAPWEKIYILLTGKGELEERERQPKERLKSLRAALYNLGIQMHLKGESRLAPSRDQVRKCGARAAAMLANWPLDRP